jgi:hypothetical protein
LWQMDFKAPVRTIVGECHPLSVLDDHSRFNLLEYGNRPRKRRSEE